MYSSKITQNLAFAGRQLSFLVQEGMDLDQAFERLLKVSDGDRRRDVERLRDLISGNEPGDQSVGLSPYSMLARLAGLVRKEDGSLSHVLAQFDDYVSNVGTVVKSYWTGMAGLLWYLIILVLVAMTTISVFSAYVIPSFRELFDGFGAQLPALTQAVFGASNLFPVLAGVVGVAILASAIWFAFVLRRRLQQMAPLGGWSKYVPFVGDLSAVYDQSLIVNYARIALASRVGSDKVVQLAETLVNSKLNNEEISLAHELGSLSGELQHQCDVQLIRLTESLVNARERFALVSKLFLYVVLGIFIVAMYLPIFKMGSVI